MKHILTFIALVALSAVPLSSFAEILKYKVSMRMRIPRVYNNSDSKGSRRMEYQTIKGELTVDTETTGDSHEPTIKACSFYNITHRINGKHVTYESGDAYNVTWRYIGSNKTGEFKRTCLAFSLILDPSYNIGEETPENTLSIDFSGYGSTKKRISGRVTGTVGCVCGEYGHVSPTRTIDGVVNDICPTYGTFKATLIKK